MPTIPDLPGILVPPNSDQESWLKAHVAGLCQMEGRPRFPGSQPVSFGTRDLEKLESLDFWVCEKSDGIRVLFLVSFIPEVGQSIYLIDRHNTYHELSGIFFPHHENPLMPLRNTIVDGELVIDVDPHTKKETLRLLAFDCLVADDQNVMSKPLDKRYGRLQEWFYKPYAKMVRDHPRAVADSPFDIKVKEISLSYHVEKVFTIDIPALQHGNDGLIYTCVNTPYTPGTDPNIMKWKPPSENSIDFKLVLRFPPSRSEPDKPDFHAKPIFLLHAWTGDERGVSKYEQYDEMYMDDDEWERMKLSREQVDDRIVEVHWDQTVSHWRMMRFRDDKPNGNHINVIGKIVQSIVDGVEKDTLLARSNAIRSSWKNRLAKSGNVQPQSQLQHHPPPLPPPPPPAVPQAQMRPLPPPQKAPLQPSFKEHVRYGPLAPSPWSKVSGPEVIAGFKR